MPGATNLRIGVDSRGAVKGFRDYKGAADKARKSTEAFDGRLKGTEGSFRKFSASSLALKASLVGLATGALAAAAKRMFELGSAAEETASKYNTVFGSSVRQTDAFLAEFGRTAGETTQSMQELLATTGAVTQGFGFSQQESAAFSEEIVRLAGDLASFNNTAGGTAEVTDALITALAGERERIKRFGIVLREEDVVKRALIESGKSLVKELSNEERARATLALITERAGVAIGDLERTQNSSANTARRVTRDLLELRDAVGTFLLPVFSAMLTSLDRNGDAFEALAVKIRDMATEVAVATLEIQKLDNFIRVITFDKSFNDAQRAAEQLNREIANLRAIATGVYDDARANADVMALAFGLSADEAARLATEWDAFGRQVGDAADEAERMAAAVTRIGEVSIGAVSVVGPGGGAVGPRDFDLAGTRRFGRNQGPFVTGTNLADFSLQEPELELFMLQLQAGLRETNEEADQLATTLLSTVPGIASLVDGLFSLSDVARGFVRGIGDIVGGVLRGNPLGIIGGGVNIVAGLFSGGESGADQARRVADEQRKLAEATRKASEALEKFGNSLELRRLAATGGDVSGRRQDLRFEQERQEILAGEPGFDRFLRGPEVNFGEALAGFTNADDVIAFLDTLGFQFGGQLGDALQKYIELLQTQGLELEAFNRAQEEAIAAEAARTAAIRDGLLQDFAVRKASLGGDEGEALRVRLKVDAIRELATLRELVDAGTLTEEMFAAMAAVIVGEVNAAIAAYTQQLEDQAAALEASNRALSEDLDVRALRAQGLNEEADLLRLQIDQQRELNQAIEDGITGDLLAQLRGVQGLELSAFLNQGERGADILGNRVGQTRPDQTSVTSLQEVTGTNILFINRQQLRVLESIDSRLAGMGGGFTPSQQLGSSFQTAQRSHGNPVRG